MAAMEQLYSRALVRKTKYFTFDYFPRRIIASVLKTFNVPSTIYADLPNYAKQTTRHDMIFRDTVTRRESAELLGKMRKLNE